MNQGLVVVVHAFRMVGLIPIARDTGWRTNHTGPAVEANSTVEDSHTRVVLLH